MAAEVGAAQGWAAVRLTEARQVAELMGRDPDVWPDAALGVEQGYRTLRGSAGPGVAIGYLAHALPRLESVGWAARVVEDAARADPPPPRARRALDAALRWLGDPRDAFRYAARDAADAVGRPVAEQFLAKAVFYAGGSIAPADSPAVMPPPHVAARYAAAAIADVAHRSDDPDAVFARALSLGEVVAMRGLPAIAPEQPR